MKHFTKRETFRHKEDAIHLAKVIRSNGIKARIVGSRNNWTVYEGLKFARLKGWQDEPRRRKNK